MVTVHRAFGFRFVIFANDHGPAHVHVMGQGGEARIVLYDTREPELEWLIGLSRSDARRILLEVIARREKLLDAWRRIHG